MIYGQREETGKEKRSLCILVPLFHSFSLPFSFSPSLSLYLSFVPILIFPTCLFKSCPRQGMLLFLPLIHLYVYLALYLFFSFSICLSNAKKRGKLELLPPILSNLIHIPSPVLGQEGGEEGWGCQTEMTDKRFYTSTCGCSNIQLRHLTLDVSSLNLILEIFSIKTVLISM